MRIFLISLLFLSLIACSTTRRASTDKDLMNLQGLMTGTFNSAEQAARDSSYFDINLHMYPIWQKKYPGEHWLYVEQAVSAQQDRPYRQRVYKLEKLDGSNFRSVVYELPEPEAFAGKWNDPKAFKALSAEDLILREGCAVYLEQVDDNRFRGSTREQECASTLQGAAYATSEVDIQPGLIISWDRGFNSDNQQVWGATMGGYIFRKIE